MADNRIFAYDTLIGIFKTLPDKKFLTAMQGSSMRDFLNGYCQIGEPSISKGCSQILQFLQTAVLNEQCLETMAVDRTHILRAPQKGGLKPPYESLYCEKEKKDGLLARLQKTYIASGSIPVDAKDTADFLLVELDFVKQLIRKGDLSAQKDFLSEHLGAWLPAYVTAAAKEVETEFYLGWLNFLNGFIRLEREMLG